jgi:hypothetical protein
MIISIKKREDKKHIISYKRKLGDECWIEADDFLVMHDLSHYAIEKNLGFKTAFWGMIKDGLHPSVFEDKQERDKLLISNEAWYAEYLANLFLIELSQGKFENINEVLKESIKERSSLLDMPELGKDQINDIRNLYEHLVKDFKNLSHNDFMTLEF